MSWLARLLGLVPAPDPRVAELEAAVYGLADVIERLKAGPYFPITSHTLPSRSMSEWLKRYRERLVQ